MVIDLLEILVLAAHLVAVNVAGMGPLVCLGLALWGGRRGDSLVLAAGRALAWWSLVALVLGALLGATAGGLLWIARPLEREGWRYLAEVRPSRLWFTALEWLFSAGLGYWYACLWERGLPSGYIRRGLHHLLAIASATNLLYHFPTLFAAVGELNLAPELRSGPYHHAALLARPGVLANLTHHLVAALAVTGCALVAIGQWPRVGRLAASDAPRVAIWGARLALVASLLAAPAGLAVLVSLPEASQAALLGGRLGATTVFVLSLAAVLPLLRSLLEVSLGDADRRRCQAVLVWQLVVVLLMTAVRHQAREPLWETLAARAAGPTVSTAASAAPEAEP